MNFKKYDTLSKFITLASFLLIQTISPTAQVTDTVPVIQVPEQKTENSEKSQKNNRKIDFKYENEDLVNVINFVAGKRDMNIILPLRPDDKITAKLTWSIDKKITLDEAWNILLSILDIAGYCITPKSDDAKTVFYEIVKSTEEVGRQTMPLYVGTPAEQLPQSEQQIRYIYYLSNIKLEEGEGKDSEMGSVLKTLLPVNSSFKINPQSNSLLIMAPATDVRSIMAIISQLDRPGFKEEIEAIELLYADARTVAGLFKDKILQNTDANKYRLDAKKASEASYFSKYVRLIAYDRKNTLIVIGRPQALERVKEFITKYVDVKPESGDSILHTYQLQYLDAGPFAEILRNIVHSKKTDGAPSQEQSTGEKKTSQGPERFFEDVIITIDRAKGDDDQAQQTSAQSTPDQTSDKLPAPRYYGSNTLIIAARGDDWKRIKELIETLDKPQPQVLIEVLIADITAEDSRALGNMFRNPLNLPVPGKMNVQSAQLDPGVIASSFANPAPADDTIGAIQPDGPTADLGRTYNVDPATGIRSDPATGTNGTSNIFGFPGAGQKGQGEFTPGSAAISVSDPNGNVWNITKIRKALTNTRILSHPHFISTNNQNAYIENTSIRLLPGDVKVGEGGAAIQEQVNVPASLKVTIRPQISIADPETNRKNTVTLQVRVDINEFQASASSNNNTRTTRNVTTNAIVNSGDVLALGGLLRNGEVDAINETPLLSRIPLLGSLFRNKDRINGRTNLTVFISATVIEPRLRGGVGDYTRDYVTLTKNMSRGDMFTSLKDPITRWFFQETKESLTDKVTDKFMSRDETHKNLTQPAMPLAQTKKPSTRELERIKKENAAQIKNMMSDVQENPFKNVNDSAKVRLRF